MTKSIRISSVIFLLFALSSAIFAQKKTQKLDSGVLVLTLGTDTTIVHQFEIRGDSFFSKVLSLPQGLKLTEGRGVFFPNGGLKGVVSKVYSLDQSGKWQLSQETNLSTTADSTIVEIKRDGTKEYRNFPGHAMLTNNGDLASFQLFPYYGFFTPRHPGDSLLLKHVSPLGARDLNLKRTDKSCILVGSSFMGNIHLIVDKKNRLLSADARGSSLNFTAVAYRNLLNFDAMTARFVQKQIKFGAAPSLSVRDTVRFSNGDQHIEINYWRPSARGRRIFGEIVPMNRFWRLGANNATEISLKNPVLFENQRLNAGKYTLFVIPSENQWTLLINKKTGIWGTEYDASADVLRVPLNVETLPKHVEQLTLSVSPETEGGVLNIEWERTKAFVEFKNALR